MRPDRLLRAAAGHQFHVGVAQPVHGVGAVGRMGARWVERRHPNRVRAPQQALHIGDDVALGKELHLRRIIRVQIAIQRIEQHQSGAARAQFRVQPRNLRHEVRS